jgi:NAD+ kinase
VKTIAIYVTDEASRARECAADVARIAIEAGVAVAFAGPGGGDAGIATPGARVEDADLLISVGGDGTLLRAVRIAVPLGIPILGINTGRLGFLTEIEMGDAGRDALRAVLAGGYEIEERVALEASVNGGAGHFALNDVVVRRSEHARMTPFGLSLDGELIAHIPSDGIVIATPTGSTAYFLSAGGPIISPNVDAFGVAALLPHTLFARPLIVPTSSTVTVTCDSEILHANLEADGTSVADLAPGDRVTIVRSRDSVKFARTRPRAFFSRLEEKLQWGVPIKRNG